MEGYLGQIAERQNSVMSTDELGAFSMNAPRTQEPSMIDPFENTENPSETLEPKEQSQSVIPPISKTETTKKNSPIKIVKENTILTPATETTYLSRHINRMATHQQNVPQEEIKGPATKIPIKQNEEVFQNIVVQPTVNPQKGSDTKDPKFIQANNSQQEISNQIPSENKTNELIPFPQKLQPKTTLQFQSENQSQADYKSIHNEIFPIVPISRIEKMGSPEKLQNNAPKLVIGKINVEIVSAAKPQVINKIERVITEKNTTSPSVRNRFIFGLDQL